MKKKCMFVILMGLAAASSNAVYAFNSDFSAQAIANFIANRIDAPTALTDAKYPLAMSREDVAEVMNAVGDKLPSHKDMTLKTNPFVDTRSPSVIKTYSLGYMNGKSPTVFDPKGTVTREEFAVILVRFLNMNGVTLDKKADMTNYSDYKFASAWASESIEYCAGSGLIQGRSHGGDPIIKDFDPQNSISTEEVVTILDRCAIQFNWYRSSPYKYFGGVYFPREAPYRFSSGVSENNETIATLNAGYWSENPDVEKLHGDIAEILELNYGKEESYEEVIAFFKPAQEQECKTFQLKTGKIQCYRDWECFAINFYPAHR